MFNFAILPSVLKIRHFEFKNVTGHPQFSLETASKVRNYNLKNAANNCYKVFKMTLVGLEPKS